MQFNLDPFAAAFLLSSGNANSVQGSDGGLSPSTLQTTSASNGTVNRSASWRRVSSSRINDSNSGTDQTVPPGHPSGPSTSQVVIFGDQTDRRHDVNSPQPSTSSPQVQAPYNFEQSLDTVTDVNIQSSDFVLSEKNGPQKRKRKWSKKKDKSKADKKGRSNKEADVSAFSVSNSAQGPDKAKICKKDNQEKPKDDRPRNKEGTKWLNTHIDGGRSKSGSGEQMSTVSGATSNIAEERSTINGAPTCGSSSENGSMLIGATASGDGIAFPTESMDSKKQRNESDRRKQITSRKKYEFLMGQNNSSSARSKLKPGDWVRVRNDEDCLKNVQGYIYKEAHAQVMDKIGQVKKINENGSLLVNFVGHSYCFFPAALVLVSSSGSVKNTSPFKSSRRDLVPIQETESNRNRPAVGSVSSGFSDMTSVGDESDEWNYLTSGESIASYSEQATRLPDIHVRRSLHQGFTRSYSNISLWSDASHRPRDLQNEQLTRSRSIQRINLSDSVDMIDEIDFSKLNFKNKDDECKSLTNSEASIPNPSLPSCYGSTRSILTDMSYGSNMDVHVVAIPEQNLLANREESTMQTSQGKNSEQDKKAKKTKSCFSFLSRSRKRKKDNSTAEEGSDEDKRKKKKQ